MAFLAQPQARSIAVITLGLRIITLGALAASLIVIATVSKTKYDMIYNYNHIDLAKYNQDYSGIRDSFWRDMNMNFQDLYTYRYVLSVAAIGCAYTLILIPLEIVAIVQGSRIGGTSASRFLIFTDIVFCALFTSGGAAGLGLVVDDHHHHRNLFDSAQTKFYTSYDASCGLLLVAAVCTVVMIMVSIYSK